MYTKLAFSELFLPSYVNATSIIVLGSVFLLVHLLIRKRKGIPPGPNWTLPFLGDILLLLRGDIVQTFQSLRTKHGDIFSFYMGKELLIVINGYDLLYKAAVKKGAYFSSRPQHYWSNVRARGNGIVFTNGSFWKRQRMFLHSSLQSLGQLEERVLIEVKDLTEAINETNVNPFDIKDVMHAAVANVVLSMLIGRRFIYDDSVLQTLIQHSRDGAERLIKQSVIMNCFPCLKYFPGDLLGLRANDKMIAYFEKFIGELYEDHEKSLDPSSIRDIMDAYIIEIQKAKESLKESDFSFQQLREVANEMFDAGSETTSVTIRWAILILLNYPSITERLQKVIDDVISDERLPALDDKPNLPYVEAFIMETLRYRHVVPLAVPHAILDEDIIFEGYLLPKDSSVIFNLGSVFTDSSIFVNPEIFQPERFLDETGSVKVPKEFLPFGIGRRVCLGNEMARIELFLFLTAILKQFDILPAEEGPIPELEGTMGITYAPRPYKVRMRPRIKK